MVAGDVVVPECDGRCCRRFWLPFTQATLPLAFKDSCAASRGLPIAKWFVDLCLWYPLLRFVESDPSRTDGAFWTCDAWDEASGLCRIHEHRPDTCRRYPYGNKCEFCGAVGEPAGSRD